jgi:hypothetical protein
MWENRVTSDPPTQQQRKKISSDQTALSVAVVVIVVLFPPLPTTHTPPASPPLSSRRGCRRRISTHRPGGEGEDDVSRDRGRRRFLHRPAMPMGPDDENNDDFGVVVSDDAIPIPGGRRGRGRQRRQWEEKGVGGGRLRRTRRAR